MLVSLSVSVPKCDVMRHDNALPGFKQRMLRYWISVKTVHCFVPDSGVARGATGAMPPPKLLVNVFFIQLI